MSAKVWLGAMIAASALAVASASRWERPPPRPAPQAPPEAPWLTREAAAQIVGPDGRMGPLFQGVVVGGSEPLPIVRARIAEFARANHVEIDLDIVDGEVAAVRFEVMFSGCCGYEGADVFAMRIGRPRSQGCCTCESGWIDDWAAVSEDGVHTRAHVRVNRVMIRWQRALTLVELLERTDRLLGSDRAAVAKDAGSDWIEFEQSSRYLLEVPYAFVNFRMEYNDALGIQIVADSGRIVEVSFSIPDEDEGATRTRKVLRSRWGRPQVDDDVWTWRKPDRIVTAELDWSSMRVTARMR